MSAGGVHRLRAELGGGYPRPLGDDLDDVLPGDLEDAVAKLAAPRRFPRSGLGPRLLLLLAQRGSDGVLLFGLQSVMVLWSSLSSAGGFLRSYGPSRTPRRAGRRPSRC